MEKKKVFYSFHFDNDVFRVQQVRNMGVIEGNEPVKPNEWETVKQKGDVGIKNWIDENLRYKNALVVLVGEQTWNRKWVKYEIEAAWRTGKAVLGIYIHNLKCMKTGCCTKGLNPFNQFNFRSNSFGNIVKCYDPGLDAYNRIAENLDDWIDEALKIRGKY